MPDPGSHKYDIKRTRLRDKYETDEGVPEQRADEAANDELQREYPPGDDAHRYFFRIYAVDTPLNLEAHATIADFHRAVEAVELARGTIVGLYQQ